MKMILCDPSDPKFFDFYIIEAEPIKKMWKITNAGNGYRRVGSRVSPYKLMPYSDELWQELKDIKREKQELWERRLALMELIVGNKS